MTQVLNEDNFSEGTSFLGVKNFIIVNAPSTLKEYEQRIGRVIRACAYDRLFRNKKDADTEPDVNIIFLISTYINLFSTSTSNSRS